jgi:L-alanine-DL-glutamate epimerase-like enolase superfamily enzyme
LWDLAAKAYGVSVRELLGGYRSTIPTYASTYQGDREGGLSTKEQYGDFAEMCRDLGYRAFKIHGWRDADAAEEAANVLHVAERVGSDMTLMLDPACELSTFADAVRVGRACDEVGMLWYEDPMRDSGTSIHAHRKLRQLLRTPLLLTEQVRGIEARAAWITSEATDFVRADPELDLGITGTMRIAHLAEAFGLDVELHGCGPAHRACISAIRNTNYYEMVLVGPRTKNRIPPVYACDYSDQLETVGRDGSVPVPDGVGLGVTYDWDFIQRNGTNVSVYSTKS